MDTKKLTDEAIVKGLDGADVFLRDLAGSTHTSLDEYAIGILFNIADLCGDAADLINRQQVEIERLQNEADIARKEAERFKSSRFVIGVRGGRTHRLMEIIRSMEHDAIKEFAERLCEDRVSNDPVVIAVKCELKEMVGEDK